MKKTKLLLPVFSVGAIAAAVVPCVTSCSETSTLSYQPGDKKPEYDPLEPSQTVYDVEEATNEYFNRVGKKLLAQEIILDNANTYESVLSSVKVTTKLNKKYHTINFTSD
ncbi:MAG: hypothetical protein MJ219_00690 [Mycoplasmoidaceae bacterium]|nr:hypothetical protein [Mycoplasmoidaceae bacterium]